MLDTVVVESFHRLPRLVSAVLDALAFRDGRRRASGAGRAARVGPPVLSGDVV